MIEEFQRKRRLGDQMRWNIFNNFIRFPTWMSLNEALMMTLWYRITNERTWNGEWEDRQKWWLRRSKKERIDWKSTCWFWCWTSWAIGKTLLESIYIYIYKYMRIREQATERFIFYGKGARVAFWLERF